MRYIKFGKLFLISLLFIACGVKNIGYNYEAVCAGVGSSGTNLVKIFTYGKNVEKAKKLSKTHAVHAVLFKGISAGEGCRAQKPVCNTSYESEKEWFNEFFESNAYLQYVSFSNDGYISAKDRIKMLDGRYKIGVVVRIQIDLLRKRMEKEGFARALNSGF